MAEVYKKEIETSLKKEKIVANALTATEQELQAAEEYFSTATSALG